MLIKNLLGNISQKYNIQSLLCFYPSHVTCTFLLKVYLKVFPSLHTVLCQLFPKSFIWILLTHITNITYPVLLGVY